MLRILYRFRLTLSLGLFACFAVTISLMPLSQDKGIGPPQQLLHLVQVYRPFSWKDATYQAQLRLAVERDWPLLAEITILGGADIQVRVSEDRVLPWGHVTMHDISLLHIAAEHNSFHVADLLISHGAELDLKNSLGKSVLHVAIKQLSDEVAVLLIKKGADPNITDNRYLTTPLHIAAGHQNILIVKLLLLHGSQVNFKSEQGETPLHLAAWYDDPELIRLLLENGAEVNSATHTGLTALLRATRQNHSSIVRLMIKHGASVNSQDIEGVTPLHYAAGQQNPEITELLINKGAVPEAKNKLGQTPLFNAARNNSLITAELLIKHGANIHAVDRYGETPLFHAAANHQRDFVEFLIKLGAEVNIKNHDGDTPLHEACDFSSSLEVAKLLVQHKAEVDALNNHGKTPLHKAAWASKFEDTSIIEFLLKHGANVNLRMPNGNTAWDYARIQKDHRAMKLLSEVMKKETEAQTASDQP